jgi:hypothetical protein
MQEIFVQSNPQNKEELLCVRINEKKITWDALPKPTL